jgi:anti-sigma factor RsiW
MKKRVPKKRPAVHRHGTRAHCLAIFGRLSEYLDGELDARRSAEINRHLKKCINCCAFFNTFKRTVELCRRTPRRSVPKRVRERLIERLEMERRRR